jgi:predicted alpha/beta hydrolase
VITEEALQIRTEDGYSLGATVFRSISSTYPSGTVVINSGAGVPQRLYRAFALALAESGFAVFTYDYRGIGRSRLPGSLRGFRASIADWGSKDCAAVLSAANSMFPGVSCKILGHSIGLFVTGFVREPGAVSALVGISAHTGYWLDYAAPWRYPMLFAWHAILPALTRVFGYFPGRILGLPEDLPRQVAIEWADRRRPEFWWNLLDAAGRPDRQRIDELLDRFKAFQVPMLAVGIEDDPFSTTSATARVQELFANCLHDTMILPRGCAGRRLGHFGFFRRAAHVAWVPVVQWLSDR